VNNQEVRIQTQNVQGLKDESKIETTINIISQEKLYAYCVQEAWLEGEFTLELKHGISFVPRGPEKTTISSWKLRGGNISEPAGGERLDKGWE
jgi:hypothetical protein